METSEIKVRLVAAVTKMHALHILDAQHAERIIARLVGQYSDWLVNPGPDPLPEEAEASEPTEEQTTASHTFERECDWCGQTYRASRKDSRYCSKACGSRAYRALRKQQEAQDA